MRPPRLPCPETCTAAPAAGAAWAPCAWTLLPHTMFRIATQALPGTQEKISACSRRRLRKQHSSTQKAKA